MQHRGHAPSWGTTTIRGALRNLGHELGRNTIKRTLINHGMEQAPARRTRMPWKTFLKAHSGAICSVDFEVLTRTGLVRTFVLFAIDLESRRVQICEIAWQPYGAWMEQVARNLADGVDGFLVGKQFLIHHRDPLSRRSSGTSSAPQSSDA